MEKKNLLAVLAESACGDLFNAFAAFGAHHNAAVTLDGINVALNVQDTVRPYLKIHLITLS